jgi:hypothetical protein
MERMPIDNAAAAKALLISPEKRAEAILKIVATRAKEPSQDEQGGDGTAAAAGVREIHSQLEERVKESGGGRVPAPSASAVAPLLRPFAASNDLSTSSGQRQPPPSPKARVHALPRQRCE